MDQTLPHDPPPSTTNVSQKDTNRDTDTSKRGIGVTKFESYNEGPSEKETRETTSCGLKVPQEDRTKKEPIKKRPSHLGSMVRKKRKSHLADLSAAATAQPVKLNTLEKSKLDWEAYKGNIKQTENRDTMSTEEREELEAQTKGGGSGLGDVKGFLHRKEFLDRVHDRLDTQEYEAFHAKNNP